MGIKEIIAHAEELVKELLNAQVYKERLYRQIVKRIETLDVAALYSGADAKLLNDTVQAKDRFLDRFREQSISSQSDPYFQRDPYFQHALDTQKKELTRALKQHIVSHKDLWEQLENRAEVRSAISNILEDQVADESMIQSAIHNILEFTGVEIATEGRSKLFIHISEGSIPPLQALGNPAGSTAARAVNPSGGIQGDDSGTHVLKLATLGREEQNARAKCLQYTMEEGTFLRIFSDGKIQLTDRATGSLAEDLIPLKSKLRFRNPKKSKDAFFNAIRAIAPSIEALVVTEILKDKAATVPRIHKNIVEFLTDTDITIPNKDLIIQAIQRICSICSCTPDNLPQHRSFAAILTWAELHRNPANYGYTNTTPPDLQTVFALRHHIHVVSPLSDIETPREGDTLEKLKNTGSDHFRLYASSDTPNQATAVLFGKSATGIVNKISESITGDSAPSTPTKMQDTRQLRGEDREVAALTTDDNIMKRNSSSSASSPDGTHDSSPSGPHQAGSPDVTQAGSPDANQTLLILMKHIYHASAYCSKEEMEQYHTVLGHHALYLEGQMRQGQSGKRKSQQRERSSPQCKRSSPPPVTTSPIIRHRGLFPAPSPSNNSPSPGGTPLPGEGSPATFN